MRISNIFLTKIEYHNQKLLPTAKRNTILEIAYLPNTL